MRYDHGFPPGDPWHKGFTQNLVGGAIVALLAWGMTSNSGNMRDEIRNPNACPYVFAESVYRPGEYQPVGRISESIIRRARWHNEHSQERES
jgi:hypothetical protein